MLQGKQKERKLLNFQGDDYKEPKQRGMFRVAQLATYSVYLNATMTIRSHDSLCKLDGFKLFMIKKGIIEAGVYNVQSNPKS